MVSYVKEKKMVENEVTFEDRYKCLQFLAVILDVQYQIGLKVEATLKLKIKR